MKELAIIIDGMKTNYTVTTSGDVFSLDYNHTGKKEKLKHQINFRGYHLVPLHVNGKTYAKQVHRLVAEAFLQNPKNLPQVNHKDGNKDNNKVSNLEWVTEKENIQHAINSGLITNIGETAYMAKITEKTAKKYLQVS